jgi:hypothetical protein
LLENIFLIIDPEQQAVNALGVGKGRRYFIMSTVHGPPRNLAGAE